MHSKRFSPFFSVVALIPMSVAVLLSSGHANAGPASTEPVLVADINTYSEDGFRFGSVLGTIDGVSYVTLIDEEHGEELWRTDGTEAGTRLVKDIWPGSHSSYIKRSIVIDDQMYFGALTLEHGEELWKTDGTEAGTQLVKDINPGPGYSYVSSFVRLGDELIFGATDGERGTELWKTDGTEAGTQLVKDINPGEGASFPGGMTLVGNEVLFSAMDDNGTELWKTDGTTAGTQMVKDINPFGSSGPSYLLEFEGALLFTANDGATGTELWISDGTTVGTKLLKDIYPDAGLGSSPRSLVQLNGEVMFSAQGPQGREMWKTNGSADGTKLIKDIGPDGSHGITSYLTPAVLGNYIYFPADDGTAGDELWRTDGTEAGTSMVADIRQGELSSFPSWITVFGDTLLFRAFHPEFGSELWRSDGTEAGTALVKDVRPGSASASVERVFVAEEFILFKADDGTHGAELWKSDGTESGTVLVKDTHTGTADSDPEYLTPLGDGVVFKAYDEVHNEELWMTDGTPEGTFILKDIMPGEDGSDPVYLTRVGSRVLFAAEDGVHGFELWGTDGTQDGTALVKDIRVGERGSDLAEFFTIGDTLYFMANDGVNGEELWKSDGTEAGTVMVKNINPDSHSTPEAFAEVGGLLYFSADDGVHGKELWKSDGTEAGTVMVNDITAQGDSFVWYITEFNSIAYFWVSDELWKSDGTAAGTEKVKEFDYLSLLTVSGSILYFVANDGSGAGTALWKSDGTEAGTVMVKDINPGADSSSLYELTDADGTLFFLADDGVHGEEPWISDGTEAGTTLLKDINDGSDGSESYGFVKVGAETYFVARDTNNDWELWQTDGTVEGTVMVSDDINPHGSSDVQVIETRSEYSSAAVVVSGSTRYAVARSGAYGFEVWAFDPDYVPFEPLTPDRLLDTRPMADKVGTLAVAGGADPYELQVTGVGDIPSSGVGAVSLNVTAVNTEANDFGGFVTVYPCGDIPDASNLNFVTGQTVANSVITPVSAEGKVCFYVYGKADLLVDTSGYLPPGFVPMTPDRLLDTRAGDMVGKLDGSGSAYELQVTGVGDIPSSGVGAVAMNVTAVSTEANDFGGFVTVYPCGDVPDSSNLNFVSGQTIPNSVIAPVSADGKVCFYVYGKAHLLADISGYFPTGFVPLTPDRLLDTRPTADKVGTLATAGGATPYELQVTGVGDIPSSGVGAVAMNVTAVSTEANDFGGFVTVYPCGDVPDSSNLNFVSGQTIPNSVIAPVSADGKVCFYVYGKAHLLADVSGYFPGQS